MGFKENVVGLCEKHNAGYSIEMGKLAVVTKDLLLVQVVFSTASAKTTVDLKDHNGPEFLFLQDQAYANPLFRVDGFTFEEGFREVAALYYAEQWKREVPNADKFHIRRGIQHYTACALHWRRVK